MRAAVLNGVGEPLAIEDIPKPEPKTGEVLVKVVACGVCHSDLHVVKGHTPFPIPAVPGHEISGIIEKLGPGVQGLKVGDKISCTFIMPCGYCYFCIRGRWDLCESFYKMNRLKGVLYDGTTRLFRKNGDPIWMFSMGGMSEFAVVPQSAVFKISPNLPLAETCLLGCAYFTAHGAVKNQASINPGESVAVIGTGGVGLSIIQLAKAFGATRIIAVDVTDEKLELAKRIGATDVVNASRSDSISRIVDLTDGRGVDASFEAVGRPETLANAQGCVRPGGRVVAVGLGGNGEKFTVEINRFVRNGIRLFGSYGAKPSQDMPELLALVACGLVPMGMTVTRRYKLEQVNDALTALEKGETIGRSILEISPD